VRLQDRFEVPAGLPELWAAFQNPAELAGCIPGVEQVTMTDPEHFTATMTVKLPFMSLTSRVQGSIRMEEAQHRIHVDLTGQPLAFAGAFRARLSAQLQAVSASVTQVAYDMDLQMAGRLASLGEPLIRSTAVKLSQAFAENLQERFR